MKPKDPLDDFVIQNGRRVPRIHAEIANELERAWKIKPHNIFYSHSSERVVPDFTLELIDPEESTPTHYVGREMMEEDEGRPPYSIQLDLHLPDRISVEVKRAPDPRASIVQEVESSFRFVDLLVPKRISNEEIGDAVECINAMLIDPTCKHSRIWLKVVTTWFWVAINGVRNFTSAFMGKKAE
jgi:hypothetical protein